MAGDHEGGRGRHHRARGGARGDPAGQEVELFVKNTAALGQDWTFTWARKVDESADKKGRKR